MLSRRHLLKMSLTALPAVGSSMAVAQSNKPIRMIVAASAGATVDVTARFISVELAKLLGVSIIVENRPGAGGAIGSDAVAKSPADGLTLLFTGITHFAARYSGEVSTTYDPVKDFSGIAKVASAALALVVAADSPYKTLADLLNAMKAKPGEIDYASGGVGSTSHICTIILNDLTHTKAKHIPYKGNTQAVTDTAAGIVAFTCQGSGGVLPLIKSGKLRALAVSSKNRWESLPDVPTGIESGIPGFEVASWMGALAPAKTPEATLAMLSNGIAKVVRTPEFKAFCDKQSMFVDLMEQREFQASMPKEDAYWKRISELVKQST